MVTETTPVLQCNDGDAAQVDGVTTQWCLTLSVVVPCWPARGPLGWLCPRPSVRVMGLIEEDSQRLAVQDKEVGAVEDAPPSTDVVD